MSAGNGASAPSGAGASKLFEKATAKDLRELIGEYAEERGVAWPPEVEQDGEPVPIEPTLEHARALLQLDLDGFDKIARDGIYIDGQRFTDDDLSFEEQDEVTRLIREMSGDDEATILGSQMRHFLPAFVAVIKGRDDEQFSVDDARKLKATDLVKPDAAKVG